MSMDPKHTNTSLPHVTIATLPTSKSVAVELPLASVLPSNRGHISNEISSTWGPNGPQVSIDLPTYRSCYHPTPFNNYKDQLREYRVTVGALNQASKAWLDSKQSLSLLQAKYKGTPGKRTKTRRAYERDKLREKYYAVIKREKALCKAYVTKLQLENLLAQDAATWAEFDNDTIYDQMRTFHDDDDMDSSTESESSSDASSVQTWEDEQAIDTFSTDKERVELEPPTWMNEVLSAHRARSA
ncbi:hypothetical protein DXG01_004082 [Tephrocybe rancida]|nr:hypothetical protein DXG01_004082 [Tephrocybe rancida]